MNTWLLRLFLVLSSRLVGNELLLDLVGMQKFRFLLVGLIDFVLVGRRSDAEEIVECDARTFMKFDFVPQTEDFLICDLQLVIGTADVLSRRDYLPSLLHAATVMTSEARMPTVTKDSLIFVGGVFQKERGATPLMCLLSMETFSDASNEASEARFCGGLEDQD